MGELTEQILAMALKVIGGLVAIWLAKKTGGVLNAVETKYDVDIDNSVEARIRLTVQKIVRSLFQSQVRGLKKKGKFTLSVQKDVLREAVREVKNELKDTIFDVDSHEIKNMVEAVIAEEKKK